MFLLLVRSGLEAAGKYQVGSEDVEENGIRPAAEPWSQLQHCSRTLRAPVFAGVTLLGDVVTAGPDPSIRRVCLLPAMRVIAPFS